MARLYPFRALRYDPSRVNLADVVTQPYDKITPAMQDRYYAKSPYNLIRVVLGKRETTDGDTDNVYTRAAADLGAWRAEGILRQEAEPALYGYAQTYPIPGTKERGERRGFIALGQLYDYAEGVVFRHEQTFPKHKSDRLALFKALRTYPESIYMLYSDPTFTAERLIFNTFDPPNPQQPPAQNLSAPNLSASDLSTSDLSTSNPPAFPAPTRPADVEITDEYGVTHRLWKLTDPDRIRQILVAMADKQLIIADGHHRYETSLAYMQERAAELGIPDSPLSTTPSSTTPSSPSSLSSRSEAEGSAFPLPTLSSRPEQRSSAVEISEVPAFPESAMMMTFVNMDAPGITILPTHRVVFGLPGFDGRNFAQAAERLFTVQELPNTPDGHFRGAPNLLARLADTPGIAFIAATRDGDYLLIPKPGPATAALADASPRQTQLDVVQLHKLVLHELLGLDEEAVRAGENVRYLREAAEALQQVGSGNADIAFLIKPVTLAQMKDISLHLEVMPQKSTDFYPKLLSGLAMYALD